MTHDGIVAPVSPSEITADELAPYLGRCDVTFAGVAHAPPGRPSTWTAVRLAIFRDSHPLLDKTLHVFGDRDAAGGRRPFTQMSIAYERAFGGRGVDANPVGTRAPNVVDPTDPNRPAGFGRIPRSWPARANLVGDVEPLRFDAPILELPDAMPWAYFQAAPPDQQIAFLRGDEWIVLDGLHPSLSRVQTQLMRARAEALVVPRGAAPEAGSRVELVADMLAIDGERMQCAVVFRGRHDIPGGEASLSSLQVLAGLSLPGRPVVWESCVSRASTEAPSPTVKP